MASDPTTLILTSLAEGPKHGYALQQDIESFAGAKLGPGTLYGAIGRLEQRGLIEPADQHDAAVRRRPSRLTAAGAEALQTTLDAMRAVVDAGSTRLAAAPRVAFAGGPPDPVEHPSSSAPGSPRQMGPDADGWRES